MASCCHSDTVNYTSIYFFPQQEQKEKMIGKNLIK